MPAKESKPTSAKETSEETKNSALESKSKKFVELEGDDEFEDFPVEYKEYIEAAEAVASSKLKPIAGAVESPLAEAVNVVQEIDQQLWEETWEDDDDIDDFATILAQEHEKRKKLVGVKSMDLD